MDGKIEGIVVLILIVLLLFGAKRIPDLARNLGASVREVKNGFNGVGDKEPSASDTKKNDSSKK